MATLFWHNGPRGLQSGLFLGFLKIVILVKKISLKRTDKFSIGFWLVSIPDTSSLLNFGAILRLGGDMAGDGFGPP